MTLLESNTVLYFVFIATATIEMFFFMMQRSALEISREKGIDPREGRRMLPLWYALVWPVKATKWAVAIFIGVKISWVVAVTLLAATFVFSIFVPTPHQQFIPVFRRKLVKEIGDSVHTGSSPDAQLYASLYKKLFEASKDSQFS